jgi:hypothetical protein
LKQFSLFIDTLFAMAPANYPRPFCHFNKDTHIPLEEVDNSSNTEVEVVVEVAVGVLHSTQEEQLHC